MECKLCNFLNSFKCRVSHMSVAQEPPGRPKNHSHTSKLPVFRVKQTHSAAWTQTPKYKTRRRGDTEPVADPYQSYRPKRHILPGKNCIAISLKQRKTVLSFRQII